MHKNENIRRSASKMKHQQQSASPSCSESRQNPKRTENHKTVEKSPRKLGSHSQGQVDWASDQWTRQPWKSKKYGLYFDRLDNEGIPTVLVACKMCQYYCHYYSYNSMKGHIKAHNPLNELLQIDQSLRRQMESPDLDDSKDFDQQPMNGSVDTGDGPDFSTAGNQFDLTLDQSQYLGEYGNLTGGEIDQEETDQQQQEVMVADEDDLDLKCKRLKVQILVEELEMKRQILSKELEMRERIMAKELEMKDRILKKELEIKELEAELLRRRLRKQIHGADDEI